MITSAISLYELITNEGLKIPDASGNTPLVLRAIEISKLDKFSKEKEIYEDEVCELAIYFDKLNQTHFSELESYITVSNFHIPKIINSFSRYVKNIENAEDLFFKGCVVRFIQNYNKSAFQLDYVKQRFGSLKNNDAWLYAELISNISWEEGVIQISQILEQKNDTSYLFPLITKWITEDKNEERLNFAFEKWMHYLNVEDKQLLNTFCEQYGYNRQSILASTENYTNTSYLKALNNFKNASTSLKFESITS